MKIRLQDGLPYVTVSLTYRGQQIILKNVLLDTGSAGTIFATDKVIEGIVGMDFLLQVGAIIDLTQMEIYQRSGIYSINRGQLTRPFGFLKPKGSLPRIIEKIHHKQSTPY